MVPPLTARALDPMCVYSSSAILKTQYTGTSSTDFTADSVVRISFLYDLPFLETAPQMHGDTFSLERSDIDLGALQMPVQ